MRVGSKGKKTQAGVGFTLVELLVVIAIIGVLSAIMFPVFTKAKEEGRTAMCVSNLRQIGVALLMYIDVNSNHFPAAIPIGIPGQNASENDNDHKTIQELLYPYIDNGMIRNSNDGLYENGGVFACPSDIGVPKEDECGNRFEDINGVPAGCVFWRHTGCSYEYYASNQQNWMDETGNHSIVPWTALSPEVKTKNGANRIGAPLASIVHTSKKAVMGDIWFWHPGDQVPVGLLAFRNTLFADGHAKRVRGASHIQARLEPLHEGWHDYKELQ